MIIKSRDGWFLECTCLNENCSAVVILEGADVFYKRVECYSSVNNYDEYFWRCPICGRSVPLITPYRSIYISADFVNVVLPDAVKSMARKIHHHR